MLIMARTLSKDEIRELSPEERLGLLDDLWASLSPAEIPLPEWHRRALDEALDEHSRDPDSGQAWEEVRDQVFRRK